MQQAVVVTAPGDGVAPAVLLSLGGGGAGAGGRPPAQYLFNVPEGCARLALEHKLRPGPGLRAAFACDAAALAGFGGLVMRLRGEGHEQLHVLGPAGCEAAVCSLRHFIHWRHPGVLVEEASPWERSCVVYEDEHIAVAALWKPPLLAAAWPAPGWLLEAQPQPQPEAAGQAKQGAHASSSGSSSSSSEGSSDGSSGNESDSESESETDSESESSSSGSDSGSRCAGKTGISAQAGASAHAAGPASAADGEGKDGMFGALDELFALGGAGGKRRALERLKEAAAAKAAAPPVQPVRPQLSPAATSLASAAGTAQAARDAPAAVAAAAAAKAAAAGAAAPARPRQAAQGAGAGDERADVAVIGGKRFKCLVESAGINAWVCQKLSTRQAPGSAAGGVVAGQPTPAQQQQQQQQQQAGKERQGQGEQRQLLGFLCHLRATDQLILIANLHSRAAAAQLQQHPALPLLIGQKERVAGVLHLVAPGVGGSRPLRQLCNALRPAVEGGPAGGKQLLLEHPGAGGSSGQVIGHLAAARTTSKLSLVSSRLFPLPAGVRAGAAAGGTEPAGAAGGEGQAEGIAEAALEAGDAAATAQHTNGTGSEPDVEHGAHQQPAADSPEPANGEIQQAAAPGSPVRAAERGGGLVPVRCISLLSWRHSSAEQQQQQGQAEQQQQQRQLAIEPLESFAAAGVGGFDAAAVQAEVREDRPQLVAQLDRLRLLEQQGQLPALGDLPGTQGTGSGSCRRNCVAPPPPPPSPPPEAGQQARWQQQQRQQAWPGPMQQASAMQPLYWQPAGALPLAQPWQLVQQGALLVAAPVPPPAMPHPWGHLQPQQWVPSAAAGQQLPQPLAALEQQQQRAAAGEQQAEEGPPGSNKRAAEGLRARLQGGKRSRQVERAEASGGIQDQQQTQPPASPGQGQPSPDEQAQLPRWLQGVPAGIRSMAQHVGVATGSTGAGAGGPEVVFLGTGSAEPSKYRGASAIQLRLSCGQSLLLDCGEGTLGALCRAYGAAGALQHVASLGAVWVSHRHADHMSGVLPLLAAYPASLPPLLLVGPRSLRDWLAEAAPALGLAARYRFVHCSELNNPDHWARRALRQHLGLAHLRCVPVRHCSDAWGLVVGHEGEGWRLVYSGDTQPSEQLVQAGAGCTLLVHEATFEPCLEAQARQKRHSTTAEALAVAERMGAYRCILTHFSQRYPKWPEGLPNWLAGSGSHGGKAPAAAADGVQQPGSGADAAAPAGSGDGAGSRAAVAFDGMRVPLALLPVLPALMPAVQAALAEPEEEQQQGQEEGQGEEGMEGNGTDAVAA